MGLLEEPAKTVEEKEEVFREGFVVSGWEALDGVCGAAWAEWEFGDGEGD